MSATDQQWDQILDQYEGLIWKISYKISGDGAVSSLEDNYQDLCVAAMEAVVGFEKQNNGQNGKFEDFWGSKGFDKYMKTCLWNAKNAKGKKIEKHYPLTKHTVSASDNEEIIHVIGRDGNSMETSVFFKELKRLLDPEEVLILKTLVTDPRMILETGKINIKKLSNNLNFTWLKTRKLVDSIASLIKNEL